MRLRPFVAAMLVLVVLVMNVPVLVLHRIVLVDMPVPLGQGEPGSERRQGKAATSEIDNGSFNSKTASAAPKKGAVPKCAAVRAAPRWRNARTYRTRLAP